MSLISGCLFIVGALAIAIIVDVGMIVGAWKLSKYLYRKARDKNA